MKEKKISVAEEVLKTIKDWSIGKEYLDTEKLKRLSCLLKDCDSEQIEKIFSTKSNLFSKLRRVIFLKNHFYEEEIKFLLRKLVLFGINDESYLFYLNGEDYKADNETLGIILLEALFYIANDVTEMLFSDNACFNYLVDKEAKEGGFSKYKKAIGLYENFFKWLLFENKINKSYYEFIFLNSSKEIKLQELDKLALIQNYSKFFEINFFKTQKECRYLFFLPAKFIKEIAKSNALVKLNLEHFDLIEIEGYFKKKADVNDFFNQLFSFSNSKPLKLNTKSKIDKDEVIVQGVKAFFKLPYQSKALTNYLLIDERELGSDFPFVFSGKFLEENDEVSVLKNISVYLYVEKFLTEEEKITFLVKHKDFIEKMVKVLFFKDKEEEREEFRKHILKIEEFQRVKFLTFFEKTILQLYFRCRILNILPPLLKSQAQISNEWKSNWTLFIWLIIDDLNINDIVELDENNYSANISWEFFNLLFKDKTSNLSISVLIAILQHCQMKKINDEKFINAIFNVSLKKEIRENQTFITQLKSKVFPLNEQGEAKDFFTYNMKKLDIRLEKIQSKITKGERLNAYEKLCLIKDYLYSPDKLLFFLK